MVSILSIITTLIALWYLPNILPMARSDFFLILRREFAGVLSLLYQYRPGLVVLNLIFVFLYLPLFYFTRGLKAGRAEWHWVALGESVVGTVNGFALVIETTIVATNAILWVLIIVALTIATVIAISLSLAILLGLLASLTGLGGNG